MQQHDVEFHWVKGHDHNPYNNRCDQLATYAADHQALLIDKGYEETESRPSNISSYP